MKAGAEDLWNEADGPTKSVPVRRSVRSPIDVRKVVYESERIDSRDFSEFSKPKPRFYSVCSRSLSGYRLNFERNESDDRCGDRGLISRSMIRTPVDLRNLTCLNGGLKSRCYSVHTRSSKGSRFNFRRNESSEEDSDEEFGDGEDGEMKGKSNVGRVMSNAALGKYDMKKTRRVPLKFLEEEEDLSERVEAIRKEFKERNLLKNAVDKSEEDSILIDKRFDECDVSPLTVKALSEAGYVQMTRVQEATLSVCLDGKDALVKAKTGTGKSAAFLF